MKLNSIGSVTPVRNEVRASEVSMPPTAFFFSGRAVWYMARQAAGRPNIITGKNPLMNAAGARVVGEEPPQVAGRAVIVAHHEPDDVVEDVVQAGDDQDPVQEAVDQQAGLTRAVTMCPAGRRRGLDAVIAQADQHRDQQAGQAADDRHEAAAAEEGQVFGQLDSRVAVVEDPADQARGDADRHRQLARALAL
jgi:hypothetical protein